MGIEHMQNAAASTEVRSVHLGPNMPLRDQLHLQAVLMLRRYAREHNNRNWQPAKVPKKDTPKRSFHRQRQKLLKTAKIKVNYHTILFILTLFSPYSKKATPRCQLF
jgi:hypothetical protein